MSEKCHEKQSEKRPANPAKNFITDEQGRTYHPNAPPWRAPKSTTAELKQRVIIIMELLLSGQPHAHVVRYSSEKWGVSERQAQKYVRMANTRIERAAKEVEKNCYSKALNRYEELYRRALADNDNNTARLVINDQTRLAGVGAPARLSITEEENGQDLSADELRQAVSTELDKLLAGLDFEDHAGGSKTSEQQPPAVGAEPGE